MSTGKWSGLVWFLSIEMSVFAAVFAAHALVFKGFGFSDSLLVSSYALFWRLVSLQLVLQIFVLMVWPLLFGGRSLDLAPIVAAIAVSTSTAGWLSSGKFDAAWKIYGLPTSSYVPEGFALICSVTAACAVLRLLTMRTAT